MWALLCRHRIRFSNNAIQHKLRASWNWLPFAGECAVCGHCREAARCHVSSTQLSRANILWKAILRHCDVYPYDIWSRRNSCHGPDHPRAVVWHFQQLESAHSGNAAGQVRIILRCFFILWCFFIRWCFFLFDTFLSFHSLHRWLLWCRYFFDKSAVHPAAAPNFIGFQASFFERPCYCLWQWLSNLISSSPPVVGFHRMRRVYHHLCSPPGILCPWHSRSFSIYYNWHFMASLTHHFVGNLHRWDPDCCR